MSALADGEIDGAAAGGRLRAPGAPMRELRANLARLAPDRRRAAFRGPGVQRRARPRFLLALRAASRGRAGRAGARAAARGSARPRAARRPLAAAVGGCRRLRAGRRHLRCCSARPARRLAAAPTLARVAPPAAVEAPVVQAAVREPAAPVQAVAGRRPDDPRPAARQLSGGAQAVRRQLGARRAVRLPAQRDGRRRAALTRRPRACRMLSRSLVPLALACAAIARVPAALAPAPAPAPPPAPPSEVRAWLLRIHDAASRRNFQGTFVVSGGGGVASARISHFCEGRTSTSASSRSTAGSARCSATTTSCTPLWPASQVAMIEQRGHAELVSGAAAGGRRRARRVVRGARRGQRPGRRPRGRRARWSSRATRTATATGSGPTAPPGCCCAPTCSASAARCSRPRPSPTSSIGVRPQPESVLQAMKQARRLSRRAAGADADHASRPKAGRCGRPRPGFRPVSCVRRQMEAPGERPRRRAPRRCCRRSTPTA